MKTKAYPIPLLSCSEYRSDNENSGQKQLSCFGGLHSEDVSFHIAVTGNSLPAPAAFYTMHGALISARVEKNDDIPCGFLGRGRTADFRQWRKSNRR
jgi:hypothetical protein